MANANRSRSPSPNAARSQSPTARAANAGKPAKKEKVSWVNPSASKNTAFGSPSDIHQRNLGSKGVSGGSSLRASVENDENERDLIGTRPNKARSSPAAAPLNAAKNFMSPTISTSSKVTAAFPRRRVLSERNDDTRSSLTSLSDFSDFTELEENTVNLAAVVGSRPESGGGTRPRRSSDLEESLSSVSVTQTFHAAPPLEEDPSLPPYDPQTNYLSPRPRFLRYRPRPRIEYHLGDVERGLFSRVEGEQLEERFSSESSDESGGLTEEIQSSNEKNACGYESNPSEKKIGEVEEEEDESHDAIPSDGMPLPSKEDGGEEEEETHDAVPSNLPPQEEGRDEEEETHDAPSNGMPLPSKEEGGEEEETDDPEPEHGNRAIPSKETPKPRLFTRPRFLKFLFLMAFACVFASMIRQPTTGSSAFSALNHGTLRDLPLRVPDDPHLRDLFHGLIQLVNGFDGLAGRLGDWSVGSFAHFQMLVAQLAAAPVEEFGFSYLNGTTARLEDLNVVEIKHEPGKMLYDFPDLEAEKSSDGPSLTENIDMDTEGLGTPAEQDWGVDVSREADTAEGYESAIEEEIISERGERVSIDDDSDNLDDLAAVQPSGEEELLRGSKLEEELDLLPKTRDFVLPQTDEVEIYQEAEVDDGGSHGPEFPLQNLLALSSVVLALAALVVSLRVGRQQRRQLMPASAWGTSPPDGKPCSHPSPAQSHLPEALPEAVTMVGESGPSELSSSLQNTTVSSLGKRRPGRGAEQDDTFSHERDLRRDSVASSTSFGSFTTYERLSAKKKGDDALTPVRRSSRIRSQLTSP